MSSAQPPTIAYYVPSHDTNRRSQVLGILAYIHRTQNMCLMSHNADPILSSRSMSLDQVLESGIRGLIGGPFDQDAVDHIRDQGVALVSLTERSDAPKTARVIPDYLKAGAMIVRRCMEDGIERILYVDEDRELLLKGIRAEAPHYMEVKAPFEHWIRFVHNEAALLEQLEPMLAASGKPVLVVASHDGQGLDVTAVCRNVGIDIPGTVNVIGYGNYVLTCEAATPPLTSVDPDWRQIGYEAAQYMDRVLQGEDVPPTTIEVPPLCIQSRQSLLPAAAAQDKRLGNALNLIHREYDNLLTVGDLAVAAHTSRRTLENLFKKHLGRTPLEELRRVRIAQARELLLQSNKTNHAIAALCGYQTLSHFYRDFKMCVGETPGEFKRHLAP